MHVGANEVHPRNAFRKLFVEPFCVEQVNAIFLLGGRVY